MRKYRLLKLLVLSLLCHRDMHGYMIIKEVQRRTEGLWKPAPGTIYPLLAELELDGLVNKRKEVLGSRVRYSYSITLKGIKLLKVYAHRLRLVFEALASLMKHVEDELERKKVVVSNEDEWLLEKLYREREILGVIRRHVDDRIREIDEIIAKMGKRNEGS